jgi:hypothetical protein
MSVQVRLIDLPGHSSSSPSSSHHGSRGNMPCCPFCVSSQQPHMPASRLEPHIMSLW